MAKPRIDTQIPRRKKAAGPIELRSEWDIREGNTRTHLKMTPDAMATKKPEPQDAGKPSSPD